MKKDRELPVPAEKKEPEKKEPEPKAPEAPEPPKAGEPPKGPTPPTEIKLSAAEGSEIQIAFLNMVAMAKETEKASMAVQVAEAKVETAKANLQRQAAVHEEARAVLVNVMAKYGVPNGWDFERAQDGNYTFRPAKPQPPGPGPRRV